MALESGRVVITGGAGFIGSHLTDHLLRTHPGCSVTIADRMASSRARDNVRSALATRRAEVARLDILDTDGLLRVFRGADVVVHAAAETDMARAVADPAECERTNAHGTHCVLEACRQSGVGRVLFISSQMVYGAAAGPLSEGDPLRPGNPYAASKAAAERVVERYRSAHGLDVRVMRPNNVIGTRQPPDKVVPRFIGQMLRDEPLTVYDEGTLVRSYLMVEDFCSAAELAIGHPEPSLSLNVGSPEEYTNLAIAEMICLAFGRRPDEWIRFVPGHPCGDCHYRLDTSRIAGLGWRERRSLRADLPRIIDWYRAAHAAQGSAAASAAG